VLLSLEWGRMGEAWGSGEPSEPEGASELLSGACSPAARAALAGLSADARERERPRLGRLLCLRTLMLL